MSEFWLGLAGGFSGAVFGVLGSEIVKFVLEPGKRLERRRDGFLDEMISDLKNIDDIGSKYWNGFYEENSPEIKYCEQSLRVCIHNLGKNNIYLFSGFDQSRIVCEESISSLRFLVTGGDFGDGLSLNDAGVALAIRTKCGDVKRVIETERHSLRRKFFWIF